METATVIHEGDCQTVRQALQAGMEQKAREFVEKGGELYAKA